MGHAGVSGDEVLEPEELMSGLKRKGIDEIALSPGVEGGRNGKETCL
jgi:hypothetical protein